MSGYDIFAWIVLIILVASSIGVFCIAGWLPGHIAKSRNHPHQDAIHAGGWISLFTLHAIWPFLWIWATAYHPVHGYGGIPREKADEPGSEGHDETSRVADLERKIAALEATAFKSNGGPRPDRL